MGHFLKMLIGLTCMAVIGLAGFALVNHYEQKNLRSAEQEKKTPFVSATTQVQLKPLTR